MDGSKLKNIVLLILVAVNIVLLVQIGARDYEGQQRNAELRAEIVELMSGSGVSLDPGEIPESRSLTVYSLSRDEDLERKMAEAFLGEARRTDLGGNLHRYESDRGMGSFRSNGEFEILLAEGLTLSGSGGTEKQCLRLLESVGFQTRTLELRTEDGGESLLVIQGLGENAVFNCQVELDCRGGVLLGLEGRCLMGSPVANGSQDCSVLDGLLLFSNYVREQGQICKQINDIEAGLQLSGNGREIKAVWCITTDVGKYYVDVKDRAVEPA